MADKPHKTRPQGSAKSNGFDANAAIKDAQKQADKTRALLSDDAPLSAEKVEALMKQGADMSRMIEENGGKMLSKEALQQVAGAHVDPKMLAMMQQVQALSSAENLDVQSVAASLKNMGSELGLSDTQQKLLNAFGSDFDHKEAAKVPGLTVDKETGTISVLGLLNLDAKDPTSRLIAQGLIAANTLVLIPLNEKLFEKSYQGATKLAGEFDMVAASRHRIGLAAALGSTALTSFWPDINGFIQLEKTAKRQVMSMANRFAPVLDDYSPNGGRVSQLYQVRPEQNELIVNERRRFAQQHNSDRFRHAIEAVGRAPLFAISALRGRDSLPGLQQEAAQAAQASKLAEGGVSAEAEYYQKLGEKAKFIETNSKGAVKGDKAVEMAREQLDREMAGKKGFAGASASKDKEPQGLFEKLKRDGASGFVLLAAPIMGMVAQNLHRQRQKEQDFQPISAADMIFHLRNQLDDNHEAELFALPDGMTVQGSKTGRNELKLTDYVEQVFQQHERDCRGSEARIPARHDERLRYAAKEIATALREGRLDGLALIKLVGERHIVREQGKSVASEEVVKAEIARLTEQMRRIEYVDNKQYFADSSFTPEQLKASWNAMQQDERAVFAQLVPASVLESVGVPHQQLKQIRQAHQERFYGDVAQLAHGLLALGDDTLKQMGMSRAETGILEQIDAAGAQGLQEKSPRELHDVTRVITNALVASRQYEGRLTDPQLQR